MLPSAKRAKREPPSELSSFVNSIEHLRKRETLARVKLGPRGRLERLGFDILGLFESRVLRLRKQFVLAP